MAGRKAGFRHNQDTRDKIKAGVIIERLTRHIESDTPLMDASQVNAAKVLLNKVLPDLSAVSLDGDLRHEHMHMTKEQRDAAVAAASRADT